MIPQDWFIGGIAALLGLLFVVAATGNVEWYFQLRKIHRLEDRFGRKGARFTTVVVGLGLIVLGAAIAMGVTPRFSRAKQPPTATP